MAFFGTCVNKSTIERISTEDAIALININPLKVGVKIPERLNRIGRKMEMMTNGAIETNKYLDLDISSSVST